MKHNGQRRPEEIEADIERTRGDLHATLSAIEQRLSPGELVDRGLQYLRQNGVREYASNLGEAARRDPVPLALVGIGLAWLAVSSRHPPQAGTIETSGQGSLSTTGMKEKLSQTSERISHTAQAARERAGAIGEGARAQAERIRGGYAQLREHPLALGAIGLAIGAVLAASAPRTRAEERLAGDARDRLAGGRQQAAGWQADSAGRLDGAGQADGAQADSARADSARDAAQDDGSNAARAYSAGQAHIA